MATDSRTASPAFADAVRASSTLSGSLAGKPDDAAIETDVRSLRGLASVIDALLGEARQCGGPDCMGRIVDGVKLWVTQDRLTAEADRAAAASALRDRYETALRAIGEAQLVDPSGLEMLIDWRGVALSLREVARQALIATAPN